MKFYFAKPTPLEIEHIYDVWRLNESTSSDSFEQMTIEEKERISGNIIQFFNVFYLDSKIAGWITKIDRIEDDEVNIGFYLEENFRGKGVMKIVLKSFLETIDLSSCEKPLVAETDESNLAAQKTLEAVGFIKKQEAGCCYTYPKVQG